MTATAIDGASIARTARHQLVRAAIPAHLERLTWSEAQIAQHQQSALRDLLAVAIERSPFHARRLGGIDPNRITLADLASLPVMTKSEMMQSFDEVVTDRRLSRDAVEAHLASTGFDAVELFDAFSVLASGGSSGTRGVFVYDRAAAVDYFLGLIRPGLSRMVELLGQLPEEPVSVAIVSAGSAVHASRALASLFGGDLMAPISIAASDPIESIVARLNEAQPLLLQGYPSAVRRLAEEQAAGRLAISPLSVTTSSESLGTADRARIDEVFGVGVVDTFGSTEGLVGVSAPSDPSIVLANDLAIVELVDDELQPVPPGTPSSRVLLTNLFNHTQPLIRYELTDSFTLLPASETNGHLRVNVEGRSDEEFTYGDLTIHPIAVRSVLISTPAVVEYQVHQTVSGIAVRVVAEQGLDVDDLAHRLAAGMTAAGLRDPEVRVTAVAADELDRHPVTGKTRRFVPLASDR